MARAAAAIEFIRQMRAMDRDRVHALIERHAGEELAQFFIAYAAELLGQDPSRAVENGSSLLLIGYLIRCFENEVEQRAAVESPLLH
jgi:hypothetical protein